MPDHIILCADLCCDWHCSQLIDNDDDEFCVDADDDDLNHGSWANMVVIIILVTVIIIM